MHACFFPDTHLPSTHQFTAQLPSSLSTTISSVHYSSSGPTLEHSMASMKEPETNGAVLITTSESGPSSSVSASVSSHQEDQTHTQRLGSEEQDMQQTYSSHSSISSSPRHSPTPDPLEDPVESLHPGPAPSSAHHTPSSVTSSSPSSSTTVDSRSQDQSHSLTDVSTCSSHDNASLSSPVLQHPVTEATNSIGAENVILSAKSGLTSTAKREPHTLSESSVVENLEHDRKQGSREPAQTGPPMPPTNSLNGGGFEGEAHTLQGHQDEGSEDPPLPPVRSQQTDLRGTTLTQAARSQYSTESDTSPSDLPSLEPVGQSVSTHSIPVPMTTPIASQPVTTCAESPKGLSRSGQK